MGVAGALGGSGLSPVMRLSPRWGRRKRSYKQAVSELDEEQQLEEEELQAPRSKTPSPPCPASKVSGHLPSLGAQHAHTHGLTPVLIHRWCGPSGPSCTLCRGTRCS